MPTNDAAVVSKKVLPLLLSALLIGALASGAATAAGPKRVELERMPLGFGALPPSVAGQPAPVPAPPTEDDLAKDPAFFLQSNRTQRKWDEPAEPVKIAGPIHFVGTKGLGVFLIAGSEGHILLYTGMPGSGPMIEASIRRLGFEPRDVKILLTGHAHLDHVGGHAYLAKATGARIAMMREEVELFESGGTLDFIYGAVKEFAFDAARVEQVFRDGDTIRLGDITLEARLTPGHTRGSTTYVMSIPDGSRSDPKGGSGGAVGGKTWTVVFPDGTSVNPGYRVTRDPSYPGIADDYRRTFRVLASLKPDIWLTPHNGDDFDAKRARASREGARAWVDPSGYRKWLAGKKEQFESAVAKEQAVDAPR